MGNNYKPDLMIAARDFNLKYTLESGHINETSIGKTGDALLGIYQKLKLRGDSDELSYFDYLLFYFLVDSAYSVKNSGLLGLLKPVRLRNEYIKTVMSVPKGIRPDDVLEISKIILLALLSIPKFITKSIIHPMLNVYIKKIQTV